MTNIFKSTYKSFFEIKRHEIPRVVGSFIYFYLTIAAYYILKTCRNAYFVDRLGADVLPWVNIAIALLTGGIIVLYAKLADRNTLKNLINGSLLFLASNLVVFWWVFPLDSKALPFAFFIWVTFYSAVAVTQFWTFINEIFDSREAKRVYGIVGAGGIIGGMTGGYLSSYYANIFGTRHLLLLAGFILLLCVLIVSYLWRINPKSHGSNLKKQTASYKAQFSKGKGPVALILSSKYLLLLMILVALIKFASSLTEWQYNKIAEIYIDGMDDLASFFGKIFGHLNTVALFIQIFMTPFFLRRFGPGATLFLLPGGLLVSSILLVISPSVLTGSFLKIVDGSLRYSINQSAKEFIYLPIRRVVRYKIKPFIDMFVYQFAKGFAALFILFINEFIFVKLSDNFGQTINEQVKVMMVSVIVISALFFWLIIVYLLKREHVVAIRQHLQEEDEKKKKHEITYDEIKEEISHIEDENYLHEIKSILTDSKDRQKNFRLAVCTILKEGIEDVSKIRPLLDELIKIHKNMKQDNDDEPSQDSVDALLGTMTESDLVTKKKLLKQLNKLRREHSNLEFDPKILKREVDEEVQNYYRSFAVWTILLEVKKESEKRFENLKMINQSIKKNLEENVKRIFHLLSLLYHYEDMKIITDRYINGNEEVKANALELLESYLSPDLKKSLLPILDGDMSFSNYEELFEYNSKSFKFERNDVLLSSLFGKDIWLSICSIFLIGHFKNPEFKESLKDILQKSKSPLKIEAAKFVLENKFSK